MQIKKHFPLFICAYNKKVLIVGGGKIATRRLKTLLNFDFNIVVVSKTITNEIEKICCDNNILFIKDSYNINYIENCFMVLACTNDAVCQKQIVDDCKNNNIFVNSCSDKNDCDFFFPSIHTSNYTTVGIVGNGDDHHRTKQVANKIKGVLDEYKSW